MVTTTEELLPDGIPVTVASNSYGRYCVPTALRHRPVVRTILAGEVWEPKVLDLLCAYATCDIVHAGTFFGDFLPALSRSRAAGAKVWAFEPAADNVRCAEVTIALNALTNVVLTPAGLGERREERLLSSRDAAGQSLGGWCTYTTTAAATTMPTPGSTSELTRLVAIDEVVPPDRPVGVIQLDVEGFEGPALRGALRTIARCRPILVLESPPQGDVLSEDWFQEHVFALGYEKIGYLHENVVLFPPVPR